MAHYAKQYRQRIEFLEKHIAMYYHAIREAKRGAGMRIGLSGISSLMGAEESPENNDPHSLRSIIEKLPEWDCGVL